jgi:hypothetical protein
MSSGIRHVIIRVGSNAGEPNCNSPARLGEKRTWGQAKNEPVAELSASPKAMECRNSAQQYSRRRGMVIPVSR